MAGAGISPLPRPPLGDKTDSTCGFQGGLAGDVGTVFAKAGITSVSALLSVDTRRLSDLLGGDVSKVVKVSAALGAWKKENAWLVHTVNLAAKRVPPPPVTPEWQCMLVA